MYLLMSNYISAHPCPSIDLAEIIKCINKIAKVGLTSN